MSNHSRLNLYLTLFPVTTTQSSMTSARRSISGRGQSSGRLGSGNIPREHTSHLMSCSAAIATILYLTSCVTSRHVLVCVPSTRMYHTYRSYHMYHMYTYDHMYHMYTYDHMYHMWYVYLLHVYWYVASSDKSCAMK